MTYENIIYVLAGVTLFGFLIGASFSLLRTKREIDNEE